MKLGVVCGSAFLGSSMFSSLPKKVVKTRFGSATLFCGTHAVFLQRHQSGLPPHMINHKANIASLHSVGVTDIVAVSSSGSLRLSIRPGTLIVASDYMQFSRTATFFDRELRFSVPGLSEPLRRLLVRACRQAGIGFLDKGVYFQTDGPRFETRAEVRMLSKFADIVGMTMATEATLAREVGLNYASLCTVDNYANGVSKDTISWERVSSVQKNNVKVVQKVIAAIIEGQG
jgi:5'-methylthioadenosine phosphorylase